MKTNKQLKKQFKHIEKLMKYRKVDEAILKSVEGLIGTDFDGIVDWDTDLTGLDSLDQIELIMNMEKDFDIAIRDEEAEKMMGEIFTPKDIKRILKDHYNIVDIKEERKEKIDKINEGR